VSLPHGATVTKFIVYYMDNSTSSLNAILKRYPMDSASIIDIASVISSGAEAGWRYGEDAIITQPAVDLQSYSYGVEVILPPTNSVRLIGFRIDYQFGAFAPAVMKNSIRGPCHLSGQNMAIQPGITALSGQKHVLAISHVKRGRKLRRVTDIVVYVAVTSGFSLFIAATKGNRPPPARD